MSEPYTPLWNTVARSVQGVNKQQNQDWYTAEGSGTSGAPLILAVSDGHGSATHARSDIGSRYAVELFAVHAREFASLAGTEGPDGRRSLSWLMNFARHTMPRRLVAHWQQRVQGHWQRQHEAEPGGTQAEPSAEQKLVLYGATLIGAVLTPQLFAAWQLGDGELTVVDHNNEVVLPLAPAEADLGDDTESLCGREAWRLLRMHWAPITDPARMPRLIALSTDGLSKSFASDEGFIQFMTGLDQRLSESGAEGVQAVLPEWLTKAAQHSGDDTTLVAGHRLCHPEAEE
ncbi:protein phosphatase 2C domain-containing protein [Streptomyces kasugaensis]|uniref:Protein phosphatase 2C domain-containing protein n=1 Tax=Streptomyces kasugaensis TaxID=1946 RepID=A0A4Q9HZG0_STRKA|nr:protein phosphatase 2C domain-containing protein [Streptomyces kasugaensis]TBO60682.1 protein phosphatase 2C domain-containing protein [Streptomyces kasugaensis]